MKLSLDNFDEKSLPSLTTEPHATLHRIRAVLKQIQALGESQPVQEGDVEMIITDQCGKDAAEVELFIEVKKLVDSPLSILNIVPISQTKDIFNGLAERLNNFATYEREDWPTKCVEPAKNQDESQKQSQKVPRLALLLNALLVLTQGGHEKCSDNEVLQKIVNESEDPRVIAHASKLLQFPSFLPTRQLELMEKVAYLSTAQNLLVPQEKYFTLAEHYTLVNNNGLNMIDERLSFQVEKPSQSLNERPKTETVLLDPEVILNRELSAAQLATDLAKQHFSSANDIATTRSKLFAKIIWYRYIQSHSMEDAVKSRLLCIQAISNIKLDAYREACHYIRDSDKLIEETVEFLKTCKDVSLNIMMVQALMAITKSRQDERVSKNPLVNIPPVPAGSDPSDIEEKSFAASVLSEFAKISLVYDGSEWKKSLTSSFLHSETLKSSYFQHQFIQLIKNYTQPHMNSHMTSNEVSMIFQGALKVVDYIPVDYKIPSLDDGGLPEESVECPLAFNYKVQVEYLALVCSQIRPSYEEPNDLIQRIEKRLTFEIANLDREFRSHPEGEDFSTEQDPKDRVSMIKFLFKSLLELVQRDREAVGMSRRIVETTIPSLIHQIAKYNTEEKGSKIDGFLLSYFSLVAKLCSDSPGSTPSLIKNGVLPTIYQIIKDRMPTDPDSFHHLIFLLSNATLQEDGRKLAEELDVYRHIILKTVESTSNSDILSKYVSPRSNLFSLFDRNPLYKTQTAELIGSFIADCDSLVETINQQYFDLQGCMDVNPKDKAAKVSNELLQSPEQKKFRTLLTMVANFSGQDERNYERHDRVAGNRHVPELFPAAQFKALLSLYCKIMKNPSLTGVHKIFLTIIRNLVEINSFPAHIPIFMEVLEECSRGLNKLTDNKLSKLETFDFSPQSKRVEEQKEVIMKQPPEDVSAFDEDQPVQEIVTEIIAEAIGQQTKAFELTKQQHMIGALTSLVLLSKNVQYLHSQSVFALLLSTKIHPFILTVFNTLRVLKRMKVKENSAKVEAFTTSDSAAHKIQTTTQSQYLSLPAEDKRACEMQLGEQGLISNNKTISDWLGYPVDFQPLEDILSKFIDMSYIVQRQLTNEQREMQQTNQLFLGKLAFKFTNQFHKDSVSKIPFDNSTSCYEGMLDIYLSLKQLNKLASKGFISGACFFELYRLGGLHNITDLFNWLSSLIPVYHDKTDVSRQHFALLEGSIIELSTIIQRYIIQDEKDAQRGTNFFEVWQQSVFLLKSLAPFQNPKQFYQNVCYTLISEVFLEKEGSSLKPLSIKGSPTGLLDTALTLLTSANKNFMKCFCLQSSNGGQGANVRGLGERDERRRPGAADPNQIQSLTEMFPEVSQRRATQFLQQARGNLEQAIEILMQYQALGRLGINDEDIIAENLIDGLSMDVIMSDDDHDTKEGEAKQKRPNRVVVVQESQFFDALKYIQKESFSLIIDICERLESTKCQYLILECLLKKELKEDQTTAMYKKIDQIFKTLVQNFQEQVAGIKPLSEGQTEVNSEELKACQEAALQVCTFANIIQKLITVNKLYLKDATIHCKVPEKTKETIYLLMKTFEKPELESVFAKGLISNYLQKVLYDFLFLAMSFVQMVHLKTEFYKYGSQRALAIPESDRASRNKRAAEYRKNIDSVGLFEMSLQLSELASSKKLKPQLTTLCIALCLRIIIDKESLTPTTRSDSIHKLFEAFPKLSSYNSNLKNDPKIVQSVAVLNFETEEAVQHQIEKFLQRVLFAKYEWEITQKEGEADKGIEWTRTSMNGFISFFNSLSSKNQEYFKQTLKATHEAKTTKKAGQASQDLATITMKEGAFKEAKATITKERGILKRLVKTLDFKNDKALSQQFKAAKKALVSQIPETSKTDLQLYMQSIIDHYQPRLEEFNAFIAAQQAGTPLLIQDNDNIALLTQQGRQTEIDTLATMLMAYPAYSTYILPQKAQAVNGSKKSFISWYIRDYLVIEHLKRSTVLGEEDQPVEIRYSLLESTEAIDEIIGQQLNNLTGYHHLMTLNEQLVKHQLRSKFMLEALSVIQKVIKDKNQPNVNYIKQKALIKSALLVIESLIKPNPKMTHVSGDNFINSLRVCFVRDASHKDLNLPNGFLKLVDDLLTDIVDVSVPQNADFVNKCVSILKIIAEFINKEKKREESKASPKKKVLLSPRQAQQEERKEPVAPILEESHSEDERPDQVMQEDQAIAEQQPLHDMMIEDEEDDDMIDEDHEAGDDDDDEDEDDEGFVGDPVHIMEEEEVDDYGDDDDGSMLDADEPNAVVVMRRNNGPQQDIINFNNPGIDPIHNNAINWRIGERRPQAAHSNIEWSVEEAQVQGILNGLRGPEPLEQQRRQVPPHYAGGLFEHYGLDNMDDLMPPFPGQRRPQYIAGPGGQEELKKGLIKRIFEEFKIISEKELFDIVIRQKQFFDIIETKEVLPKPSVQQARRERLQFMRAEIGEQLGGLAGANLQHFHRIFGRVDELDDMDLALDDLRMQNPFGIGLMRPELGLNQIEELYGRHGPAGRPGQQIQIDLNVFDERGYSTQLRATLAQPDLNNDILQSIDVQIEEEKKEEPPVNPVLAPPRGFNFNEQPAGNNPLGNAVDPLLSAFMDSMASGSLLPDIAVPNPGSQRMIPDLFQNLFHPPRVGEERVASPRLIQEVPPAQPASNEPNTEIDQIRQMIQERSTILQQNISDNVQSLQNIIANRSSHSQEDANEEIEEAVEGNINPPQFIGAPQQQPDQGVHQPASIPIMQPNISLDDVSAFEQEDSHQELPQQPALVEEVAQQLENIRIPEEEKKEEPQVAVQEASSGRTFGYDNQYLLDNGIDPAILAELPEELRVELLSTIDIPPDFQAEHEQPAQNRPQAEEGKAAEGGNQPQPANPPAASQQQPEYYAIAQALGLDPEFLANLPEDMRMELIQQAQQQQAPPQRQAEQMDVASFVATVTDVNLRREIFMNMDEATLATLPPNLMAEARNVQNYIRQDRDRRQREAVERERQRLIDQAQQQHYHHGHFGRMEGMFGGGGRYRGGDPRDANPLQRRDKTLEEIVNIRCTQIAEEITCEDIVQSINMQIINNEKIIEALLLILLTNEKAKCDLIPCLQALTKLQNQSGVPVIRNKIVNAITFLLKAIAINDVDSLRLFIPNHDVRQKKSVLLLIGSLRLLLKSSKSLMKFILKGLVQRDELGAGKSITTQILKKQFKALTLKSPLQPSEQTDTNVGQTVSEASEQPVQTSRTLTPPSSLAEILSLIKTDYFKKDKMMLRNLSLLIQEILKKFDVAIEELENSTNSISADTIQSIADVLSLDTIDKNLLEALSDFFYQISLKKEENFKLVREFCHNKSSYLLDKLNAKLLKISMTFQEAQKLAPARTLSMIDQRGFSHNSALEEEKSEMIDGGFGLAMAPTTSAKPTVKLSEEDEKQLKDMMKISEDSDILFRVFKLLNHFYEKNHSELEGQKKDEQLMILDSGEHNMKKEQISKFVREAYQNKSISDFSLNVSEVLKIVAKTNFEVNDSISNLIFCVFSAYYPELIDAIEDQTAKQIEAQKAPKDPKEKGNKFQIKMLPLSETSVKGTKEKFTLFKDSTYSTARTEELSHFCMVNKRIINKMIKSRQHMFANELEGLIKHMPNILDFDNKRAHFKKELAKLKRNGYGGQIQMFIRRDDIFRDTYTQLKDKQADELKGRLHISFTGERGQDAGGLTRDFFIELSRAMFNPNYSLFVAASSGSTYYPNPKSFIESQHLQYFKFIGRIVGKAIFDECLLECYFVKSLYKMMTGEPLSINDMEDFDNAYYTNMKWCLENDVTCLETTMVVEQDNFGKTEEIELVPNGKNTALTNDNKREYVEKLAKYRLYGSIQQQIDSFLEGFHELIPKELVSIFNFKELELLISGLPHFDLEDLKANTEFSGYNHSSPQVHWLWEVLEVFESAERAEFLQFVTGSSKVPVEGFKGLIGMRGPQKFTIAKIKTDDIMRLPSGHTCFNQLDLPEYPSKELLHERLLIAIKETKGFGFA